MLQQDKRDTFHFRVRTRTSSSIPTIGHNKSRTSSINSVDLHIPYRHNESNTNSKTNNFESTSRNSSFLSFNFFSKNSSSKKNIPRSVPEIRSSLVTKLDNTEQDLPSIPLDNKFPTSDSKNFQLPLLLTFTKQGRCYIGSNLNSSSLLANINEQVQKGKFSKTMVQFIYGNLSTQLNLKPINLKFPTTFNSSNLYKQTPDKHGFYSIRLTPYVQSQNNIKAISFNQIVRRVGPNSQIIICRSSRQIKKTIEDIPNDYQPICFASNVISRIHGYLKVDSMGNWFIQDFKSASGTFLNHKRISANSEVSNDIYLKDGDIIQLGLTIENMGAGEDPMFRCVRMKVELNDSWKLNLKKLKITARDRMKNLMNNNEICTICLYKCKPSQALFFAPCADCWHYNCIKKYMNENYRNFTCLNCRAIFDMEEDFSDSDSDSDSDTEKETEIRANENVVKRLQQESHERKTLVDETPLRRIL